MTFIVALNVSEALFGNEIKTNNPRQETGKLFGVALSCAARKIDFTQVWERFGQRRVSESTKQRKGQLTKG